MVCDFKLPNDELGRAWVGAQWVEPPVKEREVIGTLITGNADGELIVLGTVFVIYAHQSSAICLCAAHSFEEVKRIARQRNQASHPTIPPDFLRRGIERVETEKISCFFALHDKYVECKIVHLEYNGSYDVAVLVVTADDESHVFEHRIGVDLRMPKVGDEVGLLSCNMSVTQQVEGKAELRRSMDLRCGVVTGFDIDTSGIAGQCATFTTTIPVIGGMSGAPVLTKMVDGQNLMACGVVSSDLSEEAAFENFHTAGHSTMSMTWPIAGLSVRGEYLEQGDRYTYLAQLMHDGLLYVNSHNVAIGAHNKESQVEVHYEDSNFEKPMRVKLRMNGNPDAEL